MTNPPNDPAIVGGVGLGVTPKQQRGIDVRNRLYDAAKKEISSKGIEESRVENIVEEAGTSWGTFFRYFPRKEDVLLYSAARHFRERVRPVVDAGAGDEARSSRDIANELFVRMLEPEGSVRFHAEMLAETFRNPFRFAAILDDGELPVIVLVNQLILRGQESGEIRPEVPPHICATVLTTGVIFSTAPVLRAVAEGHLPGTEIVSVANQAFEVAWGGFAA